MNALTNQAVGDYLNDHYVSTFQKVGTFKIVNGQKQGGNVASYFCTTDGRVLHAVAGPVDAGTLLREAHWVIDRRKRVWEESRGSDSRFLALWRKAHAERLKNEHGREIDLRAMVGQAVLQSFLSHGIEVPKGKWQQPLDKDKGKWQQPLDKQGRVHLLMVGYPLAKIDQIYPLVFDKILNQRVTDLPILEMDNPFPWVAAGNRQVKR